MQHIDPPEVNMKLPYSVRRKAWATIYLLVFRRFGWLGSVLLLAAVKGAKALRSQKQRHNQAA
ncbi:MAG: hypothetical protein A2070_04725 [Bdellovibrionales bacterium GWC1_52_8]|nr:MAG: hypothetical protein A2070_04725 [Bdellovibrionales bacterium GWC1_52_8]